MEEEYEEERRREKEERAMRAERKVRGFD